jgi:hypothetical protein
MGYLDRARPNIDKVRAGTETIGFRPYLYY